MVYIFKIFLSRNFKSPTDDIEYYSQLEKNLSFHKIDNFIPNVFYNVLYFPQTFKIQMQMYIYSDITMCEMVR